MLSDNWQTGQCRQTDCALPKKKNEVGDNLHIISHSRIAQSRIVTGRTLQGRCSVVCECGCKRVIKQPPLFVCIRRKEPLRWPDRCCCAATPTPRGAQGPEPRLQHPKWRGSAGARAHSRAWNTEDVWDEVKSYHWWVILLLSIWHPVTTTQTTALFLLTDLCSIWPLFKV